MALDFPSNPINGQTYDNYYWDASSNAWRSQGSKNGLSQSINQLRTASPITVGSQAERDALYPAPVQGNSVFRTDLGAVETYYGLYQYNGGSPINPGGRDAAGWYTTNRAGGLIPVKATTVTVASGTATQTALSLSVSSITSVTLDGFIKDPTKVYKIILRGTGTASPSATIMGRIVKNGVVTNVGYYGASSYVSYSQGITTDAQRNNQSEGVIGYCGSQLTISEISIATNPNYVNFIYNAYNKDRAAFTAGGYSNDVGNITGFYIGINSGTFTGTIDIFEVLH